MMGTYRGRIINANRKLLSLVGTVKAAPMDPRSVKHAVPIINPTKSGINAFSGIGKNNHKNGAVIEIGKDLLIQCAVIFPKSGKKSKFGVMIICSREPSL